MDSTPDPEWELWCYEGLRLGHRRALEVLLDAHLGDMAVLAALYDTDTSRLVTHAWQVAFGGLPMFTWQTTMRAWLFGIVVGAGRSHGAPRPSGASAAIVRVPQDASVAVEVKSAADLPFTSWWRAGSRPALDDWLRTRPLAEQETVTLIDRLGWTASEARDALGWTDDHLRVLHHGLGRALADRLAAETGGLLAVDATEALALVGQHSIGRTVAPPPVERAPIAEAFLEWRRTRGISRGRRVAWALRAGRPVNRAVLATSP